MKKNLVACLLAAAALVFAAPAQAGTITFNLDYVFSGAWPDSTSPYGTVTFTDVTGGVRMTLTSSLEDTSEFFSEWDFNTSTPLTGITETGRTGTFAYTIDGYSSNAYQADGDGLYDFGIQFASASANRFNGTDSVVFLLTGSGLTFASFNVLSAPAGGAGPFNTAAHVQGIQTCSGWVSDGNGASGAGPGTGPCGAVPDSGTTVTLLGLALLGVGYIRRKIA